MIGNIKRFEFAKNKDLSFYYFCFYNGCDLEMLPVTNGCHLNLIYDVVYHGGHNTIPKAIDSGSTLNRLIGILGKWYNVHNGKEN